MGVRLIYDGDCGLCRYTVDYARSVTLNRVEYCPYQDVEDEYPDIDASEFAASIYLIDGERRRKGAEAAFETLAIGGLGLWRWLYRRLPGFAPLSEMLYRWVSTHRELCHRLARPLFGRRWIRRPHVNTADLVSRGIHLCGAIAFASFWWQASALIGPDGILPAGAYLEAVEAQFGLERYAFLPTLLWLDASNGALHLICAAGLAATLVGLFGRLRLTAALVGYVCYLSLVHGGQTFTGYQWDVLMVECFALAAVAARAPTAGIWLARLLLFRFMLLSGAVKLLSGDATWADASALSYHFESQPLPTVLAWYAHHLPAGVLKFGVVATFVIELVLAFFVFLPRNPRLVAAGGFIFLEVLILLTGSYNFFNLLTIVLCIALLDDGIVRRPRARAALAGPHRITRVVAGVVVVLGLIQVSTTLTRRPGPEIARLLQPWMLANSYGLFAVMTTDRHELIIEGSTDGQTWRAYEFPFKPGRLDQAPRLAAPHQPRVDWQMWFAALTRPEHARWIYNFAIALLQANPTVLELVDDPFDGEPPQHVRILSYRYRFTTPHERASDNNWWQREAPEIWMEPIRLRPRDLGDDPISAP